ncbi:MAG: hypothetical protein K0S32_2442 [Bacteroidetes bacterium]|jgi:hypothetical protein|nr:hypothetical protein [Bacteroidota bacterium]
MALSGSEDHSISLQDAEEMTANYRSEFPNDIKAHYFGKSAIKDIIDQTDCIGIRIYYALDNEGAKHLVIVGVKDDESDMTDGHLAERGFPCPPYCPNGSTL